MKDTLASFFEITASLAAQTRFDPLLQRILFETVNIGQAQAGLIYLREADGARLEPHGLIINGTAQDVQSFTIRGHNPEDHQGPAWLQSLIVDDKIVATLGFEQAQDLQSVFLALECLSAHLIGIRLHNRHYETVGVLVLLLVDSGNEADLEKLRPDRIAFIQAVSGAAVLCIESHWLQARPEYVVDKATKLETINDRIHEIRTRFEVLKRDAWINYWQARARAVTSSNWDKIIVWGFPGRRTSARSVRRHPPCLSRNRCWRTNPSICSSVPRLNSCRQTTHGDSSSTYRSTSTTAANSTT